MSETIKVTIIDRNGEVISYMATDGDTIFDILSAPAVVESFVESSTKNLYEYLAEINGTEVPLAKNVRDLMFRGAVHEGDTYVFDLAFSKPEEYEELNCAKCNKCPEEENAQAEDGAQTEQPTEQPTEQEAPAAGTVIRPAAGGGRDGVVVAQLDGGMATARIDVIVGVHTLEDCLMSDVVKAKTREDESRLAAYVVLYRGKAYKNSSERSTVLVEDGDLISITPPTLSGKGIVTRAIDLVVKLFKKG